MNRGIVLLVLSLATLLCAPCAAEHLCPKAADKAVVVRGNARFTVLTPRLIRMEWSEDGVFEDRASLAVVNRQLPVPRFEVREKNGKLQIVTQALTLTYIPGGKFDAEHLFAEFRVNGSTVSWTAGMKDTLNLGGTLRTLDRMDGGALRSWGDEPDIPVKLEDGLLSRSGWSLVDESKRHLFDGGQDWDWVAERPNKEYCDWYLFAYGHDYRQALADFIAIAGRIPMPPRYAFGYWWSRYWQYSDRELRKIVLDMKRYDIPIDVFVIDMDWHQTYGYYYDMVRDEFGEPEGWTGYTWNKALIPDPDDLLDWLHDRRVKVSLNLHPASGIQPMEACYDRFAKAYGRDTANRRAIPYRMDEKHWAECYFNQVLRPLEKQGIDFWWLDWQQWVESRNVKGLNNTFWINYTFFTDMQRHISRRPILFHRWGGLGNHRYQIGFSGDAWSTWKTLDYQSEFTATASNVGYIYWSHDLGGHLYAREAESKGELYLRWLQFGAFSPVMRTHSSMGRATERRLWFFPEYFEAMREAIRLRYRLAPYIYGAARNAYDTGVGICYPMYYDFPEQTKAYTYKRQYMFGRDMVAATIANPVSPATGLSSKTIWLPDGDWFEPSSGSLLTGGDTLTRGFTPSEIPYYIRAGAVIPMNPDEVDNLQRRCDTLRLYVAPGGEKSFTTSYYEDEGDNDHYATAFATTQITRKNERNTLKIVVSPRRGNCPGLSERRAYRIELPMSWPALSVKVNGRLFAYARHLTDAGTWGYDGRTLTLTICTEPYSCSDEVTFEVAYDSALLARTELLNGKTGMFARIETLTEGVRSQFGNYLTDKQYDLLYTAAQITAHPEQTLPLLEKFEQGLPEALLGIERHPKVSAEFKARMHAQLDRP